MKSIYCLRILFSLPIWLLATPVNATWYQIEVIVFEQLVPDSDGEIWDENPGLPDRSNSIELIEELADDDEELFEVDEQPSSEIIKKAELVPYLQLPPSELRLEGIQRVLKLSREYRPLLHVTWQQPGLTSNNARAVHLQGFEEIEEADVLDGLPQNTSDPGLEEIAAIEDEDVYQVLDLIFDGTIQIRSSKFLHVDVDFAFFPALFSNEEALQNEEDAALALERADYVRLQESRKIRLNEINYFDHPIFGVILRVSRLKLN